MARRVRIRDLVANANRTVNQASGELKRTSDNANELIDYAEALLGELMDGVTITLTINGKETPIGIKLVIDEPE